ncbi:hypothetical protein BDC45DRAFT_518286 [Circinella umbellata]|nr:hypothetical protein BDC45DRAFT_518286 [Circinella umbellata]
MSLSVQRYQDASTFLKETRQQLELYELQHIYLLHTAFKLEKQGLRNSYCGAVWKHNKDDQEQKELIFAIVALDNDTLYPGVFFTQNEQERRIGTQMLMEDFFAAPIEANVIRGHDPSLSMVKSVWEKLALSQSPSLNISFKATEPICWTYTSPTEEELKISKAVVSIQGQGYFLREATTPEFPLLLAWTRAFLVHYGFLSNGNTPENKNKFDLPSDFDFLELTSEFQLGNVYVWCAPDGLPVSMVWKRRPVGTGCTIAYVYTPERFRGRGYAGSMVAAFTLKLLKTYKYVTLMVDAKQDVKENLYARVGYKFAGTMIRYQGFTPNTTA